MSKLILYFAIIIVFISCRSKPEEIKNDLPAWYKTQVIYNLDIKVFYDSDGNGLGDLKGLTQKLGYLDSLGITMIWLAPFQPSPWQDDGYDVTDYTAVDPRLGTMEDLTSFLQSAKQHNIKVVMDLVLNHTSIQHPWFATRPSWYVRAGDRPKDWDKGMGFPEVEKQTWRADSVMGGYYFHRFYNFEPDLNYQNQQVVAEAQRIIEFWLRKGVDGFRLDAVPFIIDDPRPSAEHPRHDFYLFHKLTEAARKTKPDVLLLGEANVKPEEIQAYFAEDQKGLDMMFNFEVNEYLFYALASGDASHLKEALKVTAPKPARDQWAHFLRNHDEIDLGKLSGAEIKTVYKAMGPEKNMQLYGRGIRRRLAPMLGNNEQRLLQAYTLLFSLPGTPVIRYGEEIGMGDDLSLKERMAVRTPMQWNAGANSGFTTGKPFRPVIRSGAYGNEVVNVEAQLGDSASLLNSVRKLIGLHKQHPEIAQGRWNVANVDNKGCMMIRYKRGSGHLAAIFNFTDKPQKMKMPLAGVTYNDLISGKKLTMEHGEISLPAYAAYWVKEQE